MLSADLVTAAVWGALIIIFLEVIGILLYLRYQPPRSPPSRALSPYIRPVSPEVVTSAYNNPPRTEESCSWLNVILDFIFHELRDSSEAKMLIMKQINKEFTEFLLTKTEGKFIEQLTLREYSLGESLPVFSNISLVNLKYDEDCPNPRPGLIEAEVTVDYNGRFELGIDADLMFNRTAYVCVRVNRVYGKGRLRFSRLPYTHWSFAFLQEPHLELEVTSRFEGHSLTRLSLFLESQIRRFVRKQHTLPNYKIRFKPIFKKIKSHNQLQDIYLHNLPLTNGELIVQVVQCSRLSLVDSAVEVYCTLSIDGTPQEPQIGMWKSVWPIHELTLSRSYPSEKLGMRYQMFPYDDGKANVVVVTQVYSPTPSSLSGILKGDILYKIDNRKVTSAEQVNKLISKLGGLKILVTIQRPTIDLISVLKKENRTEQKRIDNTRRGRSSTVIETVSPGNEEYEIISPSHEKGLRPQRRRRQDYDTCSLSGVEGERASSSSPHDEFLDEDYHRPLVAMETDSQLRRSLQTIAMEPGHPQETAFRSRDRSHERSTTKRVAVCKNPIWNQQFRFLLQSTEDRYLNVCVWCHLQDEGDIMIGHVSLSLCDIAIECSLTSGGNHQQVYVLVPAKLSKPGASRAALKVTSGHSELPVTAKFDKLIGSKKYVGDILLRFVHSPFEDNIKKNKSSNQSHNDDKNNEVHDTKFDYHPFTAEKGSEPSRHHFVLVDLKRSEKFCYVCGGRIWKKARQCQRCHIVSDDKCLDYCKGMVPCRSSRPEPEGSDENDNAQEWEELHSEDTYQDSKLLKLHDEAQVEIDEETFVPVLEEGRMSQNITPSGSDNTSDSDDDENDDICTKHETSTLIEDENAALNAKILDAQNVMVLLASDKRAILSSLVQELTTEEKEKLQYELEKVDAQLETTDAVLQQHKNALRLSLSCS